MVFQCLRLGADENFFGMAYVIDGAVGDQNELAALERCLVPQYAVLGDAQAVQAGANRAQTAYHDHAFHSPEDPTDEWPANEQRPDSWDQKEGGTEQQSPYPAPEGTQCSPVFNPVPGIVVADHVFLFVNVASNNRQFFHIEAALLEFLDSRFGGRVRWIDRYDGMVIGHTLSFCVV